MGTAIPCRHAFGVSRAAQRPSSRPNGGPCSREVSACGPVTSTASSKAPGWLTTLAQPEGSGSPAEPGTQAGRVTREPAARGRADPAAAGWWFHPWSVQRPHRGDLGPVRGLGIELNRAGQGRPMRRPTDEPSPQVKSLLPAPVERADRRSGIGVSRMTDGCLGYWAAPAGRGGRLRHRRHCCPTGLSGRVSAGFFGHATDSLAT